VSLTSFRQNVQDGLAAALGIPFEGGIKEGPVEDRTIGFCWIAGVRDREDGQSQEIELHAKILKQWRQRAEYGQRAFSELESFTEQLQAALRTVRTSYGPWDFRVAQVELIPEENAVEATILALDVNPQAYGG